MTPRLRAAAVHVFTACGAACAMFATVALFQGRWQAMFAWLGVALVIDALDGPMARRAHVKAHLPRFDGERLDLIIDYITYVFVPALAMWRAGFLPGVAGEVLTAGILMSSLFHFADTQSKTEDNCFVGFPAIWNAVALYIFAFSAPPATAMVVTALLITLTFVPMKWVHPVRVVRWRAVTAAVSAVWGVAATWCVATGFPASGATLTVLSACALYAFALVAAHGLAAAK